MSQWRDRGNTYSYPEAELEAALQRAFVQHRADYIVIDSRRHQFLWEGARMGLDRGWLSCEVVEPDEQSTELRYRLTEAGRTHFGVGAR